VSGHTCSDHPCAIILEWTKGITEYNQLLDNEILYQSQKPVSQDDNDEKMKNLQKMRDEGLISEQQYNNRKSQVASKK